MQRYLLTLCIVWLSLLLCAVASAQTTTPLAANGQLQVLNRQLCNASGKPVQLRGISSHGLQWFDNCYTQGSVQALATQWGADVFRAAMYVDEGGYLNNQSGLRAKIDQIVDWTAQNGVYCIIDWHVLNPGNPNDRLSYAIDFFRIMAQKHGNKAHVIYEICNEPNGVDWNTIKNYADQVIPVIKQYAPNAIILVGTPQWCQRPQDVLANPLTGPNARNIMYTFHYYAGSHYFQNDIRNVSNQLPLFCSEWGTSSYSGDGGGDYANAQAWNDLMAGNNPGGQKISWCNWSFADKSESSAALNPNACSGQQWNNTTYSGTWVKDHILNPGDDFGPPTPTVTLTTPASNTTLMTGSSLVLSASVSNTTATTVEFYNGTTRLGDDATAPYTWPLSNLTNGTYSFSAKAILGAGGPLVSSAVTVTVAPAPNQLPAVSLTSPANNASFTAVATVTLAASASDTDGTVTLVEFYNGSTKLGDDAMAPYTFTWSSVAAGTYTLSARATDNSGGITNAGPVTITVIDPNAPAPSNDPVGAACTRVNEVKTYELSAANLTNATNFSWWFTGSSRSMTPTGGRVSIDFGPSFTGGDVCVGVNYSAAPWYKQYCKTVTVCTSGTSTTPPSSTTVTPPPPPPNQVPTVALTTPANNVTFTAPASVTLTATANDTDGSVSKVEFFNGTTKLGESTTAPYRYVWTSVPAGSYVLSAKATDNTEATTMSGNVTILVSNPVVVTPPPTTISTADILGPDCARPNNVFTYSLNSRNLPNSTAFSWWCTGSTQSLTPTGGQVSINFGPWFGGGQVCVGVNYSAAPWYKQYCKSVAVCSGTARVATESVTDQLYPNPATHQFTFVPGQDVQALRVVDMQGREKTKLGAAKQGQPVVFGEQLQTGHYLLHIQVDATQQRTIKLLKIGE